MLIILILPKPRLKELSFGFFLNLVNWVNNDCPNSYSADRGKEIILQDHCSGVSVNTKFFFIKKISFETGFIYSGWPLVQ